MAKYYCILFDADNTLLDFDAAERKALAETLTQYGIEPSSETMETYRTINEGLWRQLEKGQIRREKLMNERFTRFLKEIGAAGNGAEMNRYYLNQLSTHPDLMPGNVLDVLHELAEVATLAIVSNGAYKVQSARIADSGIARFMDGVYISEKVGASKPSARIFDAALRDLGVNDRSRVLVVGDDLLADIRGGQSAGLDTCWVNFDGRENESGVEPKYTIGSYEALYHIVMEPEELENLGARNRRHRND